MNRDELLKELRKLQTDLDPEANHVIADGLLLRYINDPEVYREFMRVRRWYG